MVQNGPKGETLKIMSRLSRNSFVILTSWFRWKEGNQYNCNTMNHFSFFNHILLKAYFCCAYFLTFFTRARKTLKIEQPRWNNLGICKGYKTTHCIFYPTILQKYYLHFSPEKFLVQKSWKIFSSLRFWQSFQIYCRFSRPGENLIFVAVTDFKIKIY